MRARMPPPGFLPVAVVETVDDFHSLDDSSERCETLFIQAGVVDQADVDLGQPGVRTCHGVGDGSFRIALDDRVVGYGLSPPRPRDFRIAGQSPLRDEARNHPAEALIVVKAVPEQVVETVRTDGGHARWTSMMKVPLLVSNRARNESGASSRQEGWAGSSKKIPRPCAALPASAVASTGPTASFVSPHAPRAIAPDSTSIERSNIK